MSITTPVPRSGKRAILLEATLEAVRVQGPINVRPSDICEELGLSKALVNYHFGGREGLIAESLVLGYSRYVAILEEAVASGGPAAIDRLMAWFEAQVRWTQANPGLAAGLNFPAEAGGLSSEDRIDLGTKMSDLGLRNFNNLVELVKAAHRELTGLEASDPLVAGADSAAIGWLCLGLSVYASGQHLPTAQLGLMDYLDDLLAHMRTIIIGIITKPSAI